MSASRSAKIHPVIYFLFLVGVIAGGYVQYSAYQAKKADEIADKEAENRPRGLAAAADMMISNPRPERTRPYKFVFSDTGPTRSELGKAELKVAYPLENSTSEKFGTRHLEIMLDGVKHFRKANSFNKKAIVAETADLLEEIVQSMHVGMGTKLVQYRERLSPILIDPQVSGDPFFQYLAGLIHIETAEHDKAEELFFGSIFDHTKYDYPSRYVLPAYNSALENGLDRNIHSKVHERAADAIVCWLKHDFAESPEDQRYVWDTLSKTIELLANDGKLVYVKKVLDLDKEDPFIPDWLGTMMTGKYYSLSAESFGSDESVTEKQQSDALGKALSNFERAFEIAPGFPESLAELVEVSKKLGDSAEKPPSHWVDVANKRGFDDYRIHQRFIEACESPQQKMEHGINCFETGKFDSAIPFVLVGAYRQVQNAEKKAPEDKTHVAKVIECLGELAADTNPKYVGAKRISNVWLLSAQAAIASNAGDNKSAAKAFEALGDKFDKNVLTTFPGIKSISKTRVRVAADASGSVERIDRIEALLEKQRNGEDQSEAIDHEISEALKLAKGDKVYFESVGTFNNAYSSYEKGETTQLEFGSNMLLWNSETESQLETNNKDSIVVSTLGGQNHALLTSTYYTPGPKTIELDVEFISKNDPCAAEIVFGGWRDYGPTGVVTLNGPGKLVGFGSSKFNGNIAKFKFNATDETDSVKLNVADGYIELFINNQFVMRSTSSRIKTDAKIGLGLNGYGKLRGKVKFSNVRVTKWNDVPPLAEGDLVAHYTKLTKARPDVGYNWLFRGIAELKTGGHDAARKSIRKAVDLGVPEFQAAPYLGEISDQKNDPVDARVQYQIVFEAMKDRPAEILQTGDKSQTYDQFQVAAARFLWNEITREDLSVESRLNFVKTYDKLAEGNSPLGSNVGWITKRLAAQARSTMAISEFAKFEEAKEASELADKALEALALKEGFGKADKEDAKSNKGKQSKGKSKSKVAKGEETEEKEKSESLLDAERTARSAKAKLRTVERKAKSEKRLALRAIDSAIESADEEFKAELGRLKSTIEAGTLYSRKNSEAKPSYLGNDELPTFSILRDLLRAEWKEFYR